MLATYDNQCINVTCLQRSSLILAALGSLGQDLIGHRLGTFCHLILVHFTLDLCQLHRHGGLSQQHAISGDYRSAGLYWSMCDMP
jgi:hypothetical protein